MYSAITCNIRRRFISVNNETQKTFAIKTGPKTYTLRTAKYERSMLIQVGLTSGGLIFGIVIFSIVPLAKILGQKSLIVVNIFQCFYIILYRSTLPTAFFLTNERARKYLRVLLNTNVVKSIQILTKQVTSRPFILIVSQIIISNLVSLIPYVIILLPGILLSKKYAQKMAQMIDAFCKIRAYSTIAMQLHLLIFISIQEISKFPPCSAFKITQNTLAENFLIKTFAIKTGPKTYTLRTAKYERSMLIQAGLTSGGLILGILIFNLLPLTKIFDQKGLAAMNIFHCFYIISYRCALPTVFFLTNERARKYLRVLLNTNVVKSIQILTKQVTRIVKSLHISVWNLKWKKLIAH
uniref:Bm14312 n=1 Tax=Brugia malayi TaxID=6279 RepID=A0A0J9Y423_BRUMA|nr:Bm14312 [Brugia malayi]